MKKLVLLVAILALCVPSYGTIRVFNVKVTGNPVVTFTSSSETSGGVSTASLQAYAVFDVDANTGTVSQDVNNAPAVIVYGTFKKVKVQQTFGNGDPNSSISFHAVNDNIANSVRPFTDASKPTKIGYEWIDCEVSDSTDGFDLSIMGAFGKITSVADVGTGTKQLIAKSLKGAAELTVASASTPIVAMGSVTLTHNANYTINANKKGQTVAQTVTQIQAVLQKQKYNPGDIVGEMLD